MMTYVYNKLYVTALTAEQHEKTAGYWYVVTNGAMSHTAFETRAGLDRWLAERGLTLAEDLPTEHGVWGTTRIIGEYRTESHGAFGNICVICGEGEPHNKDHSFIVEMVEDEGWKNLTPIIATATLSNGDYTLALITEDDGVRTVHTLNPNVKTRVVFDRKTTAKLMR